jgi:hypothetical protein
MFGRLKRLAYGLAGRLPAPVKVLLMQTREARFLVGVLAVVTDDRGRILLFRHTYRPFAPWGLPSGVLKADESLEGEGSSPGCRQCARKTTQKQPVIVR